MHGDYSGNKCLTVIDVRGRQSQVVGSSDTTHVTAVRGSWPINGRGCEKKARNGRGSCQGAKDKRKPFPYFFCLQNSSSPSLLSLEQISSPLFFFFQSYKYLLSSPQTQYTTLFLFVVFVFSLERAFLVFFSRIPQQYLSQPGSR